MSGGVHLNPARSHALKKGCVMALAPWYGKSDVRQCTHISRDPVSMALSIASSIIAGSLHDPDPHTLPMWRLYLSAESLISSSISSAIGFSPGFGASPPL